MGTRFGHPRRWGGCSLFFGFGSAVAIHFVATGAHLDKLADGASVNDEVVLLLQQLGNLRVWHGWPSVPQSEDLVFVRNQA